MAKKKISPINEEFDFKLLVTIAKKNTMWLALFLLTAILIALLILRYTAPTYEATSVIQLSEQNNAKSVLDDVAMKNFNDQTNNKLASSIELIRSKVIIERVIRKLPLRVGYYSKGEILSNELYKLTPFTIEYTIKDSSIIGRPIYLNFLSDNTFKLVYPDNRVNKNTVYKTKTRIDLPGLELKVYINDHQTIKALQEDLSKDAF